MSTIDQQGVLLTVKPLDFVDKETGEVVKGVQLILCRPSENPMYEGYGMTVFKLVHFGEEGFAKVQRFIEQARGLYMRSVLVSCLPVLSGSKLRLVPLDISPATASLSVAA